MAQAAFPARIRVLATSLVAILAQVVASQNCGNETNPGHWYITSQDDAESFFNNCTVISGEIEIASNYTGSFVLPEVTYIDQFTAQDCASLTSVEINNLNTSSEFKVALSGGAPTLSLPSLALASVIEVSSFSSQLLNLSLPALVHATYLQLDGNYSSVSLPLLEDALSIALSGNISSISLPKLVNLTTGFTLTTTAPPQNITLPALQTCDDMLDMTGQFQKLSLPALVAMGGTYLGMSLSSTADEKVPFDVSLPSLTNATRVVVDGPLESLDLSSLKYLASELSIFSTVPFNCTPYLDVYMRTLNATIDPHVGYSCTIHIPPKSHSPSKKAKLGIGLGLGLASFLAILGALGCFCYRSRKARTSTVRGQTDANEGIELNRQRDDISEASTKVEHAPV